MSPAVAAQTYAARGQAKPPTKARLSQLAAPRRHWEPEPKPVPFPPPLPPQKAKKTPPSSKGKDSGGGANAKQPARKTPPQQEKKQSDGDLWTADRSKPTAATIDKPQKKTKTPPRQQQQVAEVVSKPNQQQQQQQQQPTASVEEELLAAGARRSSIEPEAQKEVGVELMEPVDAAAIVVPVERAVALAPEWRLVAPWSSKQWLSSAQLDLCADGVVPVECRGGEWWWWN